jgi:hypothetical protein
VPRILQLVALLVALALVGAPTWVGELIEEVCASDCPDAEDDECTGDEGAGGCEEQGCTDCSVVCGSCARGHHAPPVAAMRPAAAVLASVVVGVHADARVPVGPPPQGIFHPPRIA